MSSFWVPPHPSRRQISLSRTYYPLVGLLLGLLLVGFEAALSRIFPVYLTSAILMAALLIATRGLHMDGFMDVCDGLFGGYTKEWRLEIMRDSHVGSFAVAGGVSIILLKWAAILSLLSPAVSGGGLPCKGLGLLLFPLLSRWAMVLQLSAFPYARSQGLGTAFHQFPNLLATLGAATLALVAAVLLAGVGGVVLFSGIALLAWLLGRGMTALLGGITGDTYGATNEITEVIVLGTTAALMPHGLITPLHELLGV